MTNQKKGAAKVFHAVRKKWKPEPQGEQAAAPQPPRGRDEPRSERRGEAPKKTARAEEPEEKAEAGPRKKVLPGAQPLDLCLVAYRSLLAKALSNPGTYQQPLDGLTLVKLKNKSLIASLGRPEGGLILSCKVPVSGPAALAKFSWASPAGRTPEAEGWVVARFARGETVPLRMLLGWIEESYRAVAPPKR